VSSGFCSCLALLLGLGGALLIRGFTKCLRTRSDLHSICHCPLKFKPPNAHPQEAKIALIRLHQRFTFELQPGQVPLALRQGLTLSPAKGVWVTPVVRPAAAAAAEAAAGVAAEAPVVAPAAA